MPTITIRNLDAQTKDRLRERAAASGRSMEEEARIALRSYVAAPPAGNVYDAIRQRFEPVLGMELPRLSRGRLQVAAIARARGAAVATVNIKHFKLFEVPRFNPWDA